MNSYLFFGSIAVYLIGAISALIFKKKNRLCTYASFLSASIASILGIIFSFSVLFGDTFNYVSQGSTLLSYGFYVDKLSAFFILIISITGFAVSIYSTGYVTEYFGKKNIGYLGFLYNIFIILSFLIFASSTGSFNFETFRGVGATMPPHLKDLAFIFALIGFGTKAGIVPFHIWLPYAHPAAPSNVSALMSGVMIKTAIFMLIRVFFDFLGADVAWWGIILLIIASISALLGVMYALMEHDMKSLLAYHSVENIGIILIGVGVSMIFMASGHPDLAAFGLIAGLYHTINHAVFKSLLFMGAGSILFSTHTRNIEEYGGLIKNMPWTALFFLIGAISISALPPFNGFVSEWLTFQAQLLSINLSDNITKILVLFSGAGLALTSALAAACFVKAFGVSFLALPRSDHAQHSKEVPVPMLIGMGILSLMCIVLGVLPFFFIRIIDSISSTLVGVSIISRIDVNLSIATLSAFPATISTTTLALLVGVVLPLPIIIYLMRKRVPTPKYETWGCGQ